MQLITYTLRKLTGIFCGLLRWKGNHNKDQHRRLTLEKKMMSKVRLTLEKKMIISTEGLVNSRQENEE